MIVSSLFTTTILPLLLSLLPHSISNSYNTLQQDSNLHNPNSHYDSATKDDNPHHYYTTERLQLAADSANQLMLLYGDFKTVHGHHWPPEQKEMRLGLFLKEVKKVLEMRTDENVTWSVGLNFMADWTKEEWQEWNGWTRDHV